MAEYYVGEIILVPYNFAPVGFKTCDGQLLPIADVANETLFQLIGTTYGGDGQTTFALPNLQSRVPIHVGQGPQLSNYQLGDMAGAEAETLLATQMPVHTHAIDQAQLAAKVRCLSGAGTSITPAAHVLAAEAAGVTQLYSNQPANADMRADTISVGGSATINPAGGNQAHDNRQPTVCLRFCICLSGVFPSSQ
jgi:microcystin-dependent protein